MAETDSLATAGAVSNHRTPFLVLTDRHMPDAVTLRLDDRSATVVAGRRPLPG